MNYETFRAGFSAALRDSRLKHLGGGGTESLDLQTMDRTYQIVVEPIGIRHGLVKSPELLVVATASARISSRRESRSAGWLRPPLAMRPSTRHAGARLPWPRRGLGSADRGGRLHARV
jgi:hypothetical protein